MKYLLRKSLVVLLVILSGCSSTDENEEVIEDVTDGLTVYYKFDGDTKDVSGNNFHTTSNATLTNDRFGNVNSAFHFNGVDEYIDFPNVLELKPQLPVTISFWVYFDNLEVTKTFMFTTDFAQNLNTGINMSLTSDKSSFAVAIGDGGSPSINSRRTKVANSEVKVNTWYFVVVTIVGGMDMDIHIKEFATEGAIQNDGGEYSGNGGDIGYSEISGSIGRKDANSVKDPYYFKGRIDEFRIWNRKLTNEEINLVYSIQAGME